MVLPFWAPSPVIGAYVASGWLMIVALNLAVGGRFDVAVRDVVMAIAALTLARLLELRGERWSGSAALDARTHQLTPSRPSLDA